MHELTEGITFNPLNSSGFTVQVVKQQEKYPQDRREYTGSDWIG